MGGTQTANERSALRPAFAGVRAARSLLKIEAWMPSEIKAISPLVNRLMRLIEGSRCVAFPTHIDNESEPTCAHPSG